MTIEKLKNRLMKTFSSHQSKISLKLKKTSGIVIFLLIYNTITFSQNQDGENNYPKWSPTGYLQFHFDAHDNPDIPAAFSVHRARLGFKGDVSDNISVNMIMGAAESPDNSPALVDAFADFSINSSINLQAGQFFVPFGLEGSEPITSNPAIERSYPVRQINPFRMFRDIGIMGYGEYSFMSYSLAVMNGNGANIAENLNPKDVIGKVNFEIIEDLMAGLSGHVGTYETNNLERRSRQRYGIHAEYKRSSFFVRGEMMVREDEISPDLDEESMGGYMLAGYDINNEWEAIGRIEYYDSDFDVIDYQGITLGANYFLNEHSNLSLNGIAFSQGANEDTSFALYIQLQFVL